MKCVIIDAPNRAIIPSSTTSQTVSSFFGTIHFCVIRRIAAPAHRIKYNYRLAHARHHP